MLEITEETKNVPLALALINLTMLQYFYRSGLRERFSSIQFSKAFLGFPTYNYLLHAFLVLLNTYSSHVLALTSLPFILSSESAEKENPPTYSKVASELMLL
jgi:hypothetical protein